MKILQVEHTPSMAITCPHCRAKLEAEKSDLQKIAHDQREGSAGLFNCANCGNAIWIDAELIPHDWKVPSVR